MRTPLFFSSLLALTYQAHVSDMVPAVAVSPSLLGLLQYAVKEGGLTLVVLILVWSYRRDFVQVFEAFREKLDNLKAEKSVLADLVKEISTVLGQVTETLHAQQAAIEQQRQATERMARAFEVLVDRRQHQREE